MASASTFSTPASLCRNTCHGVPLASRRIKVGGFCLSRRECLRQPANKKITGWENSTSLVWSRAAVLSHKPKASRAGRRPVYTSASGKPAAAIVERKACTLVWYKHDLRTDDHPGLHAAIATASAWAEEMGTQPSVVAAYCFDPRQLIHLSEACLNQLHDSVVQLRASLQSLGSDLIVRVGQPEEIIPELAASSGAGVVITEEEVEHDWLELVDSVRKKLSAVRVGAAVNGQASSSSSTPLTLETYRIAVHAWDLGLAGTSGGDGDKHELAAFPDTFTQFKKVLKETLKPLDRPTAVPPPLASLDRGVIPEVKELQADPNQLFQRLADQGWYEDFVTLARMAGGGWDRGKEPSAVSGAEDAILEALDKYLASGEFQSSSFVVRQDEEWNIFQKRPAGQFIDMFYLPLALGRISRRRIFYQAEMLKASKGPLGMLLPGSRGARFAVRSALEATRCIDFHFHLALKDTYQDDQRRRYWRWRGLLTEFVSAGPADGTPVLLVHGAGAFADHWRRNIDALAGMGYQVWAVTMPGFGRSEKLAQWHTVQLWTDFLRDFILYIVKQPVAVAVGNSLGGFITATCAAENRALFDSYIIMNSAGPVQAPEEVKGDGTAATLQGSSAELLARQKQLRTDEPGSNGNNKMSLGVSELLARAFILYMGSRIPKLLTWLYPTNPAGADEPLAVDIARAAEDHGALAVIQGLAYLPKPRTLNGCITEFGKPVLVLNGALDPLNNTVARAKALEELCSNVTVELLQAGHCPHDEVPDVVNDQIHKWMTSIHAATPATASA